ncbi:hypothetical protein GALMADRAFT_266960 [Galerina marginata CBS 339.88]|uniref:Heterokaryon incompatibility domain-containing protein n=1 Tax=Galerina marginata (strain CBS 339.88) TaxID=685588 RepID=A0A067TCA4_GALM3|nr:hypothetical protein GALMADRAFT_266960 [Galerina marginata CBS 339.88]
MSYVWGALPDRPLSIPCLQCGQTTPVPMLNAQRFRNLMELGGSGNTIWLDALSIDQFDARDVAASIAVMGDIYKNAKCVSVLLPASDKGAYDCLEAIERDAKIILFHRWNFIENSEVTFDDPSTGESVKVLTMVCQLFLENLKRLGEHLHQFGYWSRAWTFQEWALARDLEVAVEGGSSARTVFNLKSLVLGAAMLISRYKILQHGYVEIELGDGLSRGMIPPIFNAIKAVFPDEDLFLSYEEIDAKKVSFQANFPHLGVTDLLGIRSIPAPSPDTPDTGATAASISLNTRPDALSRTRARLTLLLSAFASSIRKAKYEADLVACWASMCNITYAYNRTDDFVTALRKAVKALRAQGIIVYDFLPDTTGGASSPVTHFQAYAREHPQLNATNNAEFPGAPVFTGRADTVSHLIYSLDKVNLPTQWNDCESDDQLFGLRLVLGSKVEESIALDDLDIAMNAFAAKVLYGDMLLYLEKVQAERRAMARLVVVKLPFYKHDSQSSSSPHDLFAWAVVPTDIALEEWHLFGEFG